MKKIALLLLPLLGATFAFAQTKDVLGFWQVVEDVKPESVVVFYEYNGAVYGRMVAIYDDNGKKIAETLANPKEKAKGLKGNPPIVGLDFIWNLKPDPSGRLTGLVIDPDSGKSFSCDVWYDKKSEKLVMRGRLFFFSQTQYWPQLKDEKIIKSLKVDASKFVPRNSL